MNRIQFSSIPAFMAWSAVSVTILLSSCPIFKSTNLDRVKFFAFLVTTWQPLSLSPSSGLPVIICPTTYVASLVFFASSSKYSVSMLLRAVNQKWTCCTGESEQSYITGTEAGHTGPELGSCGQWLSVIFLITWPLFHPEVCLSACTIQNVFFMPCCQTLF